MRKDAIVLENVLTKPIVAPVKRRRKNALVPTAISLDCNALVNTWYGACRSRPSPTPAARGKKSLMKPLDLSSNIIIKPGRATGTGRQKAAGGKFY